ncbi:hypothetical protein COV18_06230 [Candidatus Woesearchaeota archaeon CG10_big_fil_rev_8_21_14_0_10_37_12]|nr:MAG: hypothetical protein COV18_06230 [Candidatus Woesearchaeota archaeon CG10_big_fil_rev_8_21_14_0_10_37_12]
MKKGHLEATIIVITLFVAVIAIYFLFSTTGKASAYQYECLPDCQPTRPVQAEYYVTNSAQEAQTLCNEYAQRVCSPGQPSRVVSTLITGQFAVSGAKQYGGAIRGLTDPEARSFSGRATDVSKQQGDCYACSCLAQGITSQTQETASRVCRDNCGGTITNVKIGIC